MLIGNNDGGSGIITGSEADKAGLPNGVLKFINVFGNGLPTSPKPLTSLGFTQLGADTQLCVGVSL